MDKESLALLCDFYELTMSMGLLKAGLESETVYCDLFYREAPDKGGFAIAAGLEQLTEYVLNLKFCEEDIEFLRSKKIFDREFLEYLRDFKFTGDIYAVAEGTPVFPNEPIITVKGKAPEALMIETCALLFINHQTLIATKANRIVRAAKGLPVLEMGARRAQGIQGSLLGARAAFIGGCTGSSCTLAEKLYDVPCFGTMSHAWVQMFDNEYKAFKAYCEAYPQNAVLLADTYDTLKSGVPNAVKVYKEVLEPKGIKELAIRLDSGNLAELSKKARKMLDDAGLEKVKIIASNSLDEYEIENLLNCGAKIDVFGVGERLITSKSSPALGGVYKLCAVEKHGKILPKIKLSESEAKINNPHFKQIYRLYDKESGKAKADLLCVYDEKVNEGKPLLITIIKEGKLVYNLPKTEEIRKYCLEQTEKLSESIKRFDKPEHYPAALSGKLRNVKEELIKSVRMPLF